MQKLIPLVNELILYALINAAKPIAKLLEKKGGNLVVPPRGFLVTGEQGPLADQEIERAKAWSRERISCL